MFAQWDDHEVTNDWWPGAAAATGPIAIRAYCCSRRAARARSTNSCRCARRRPKPAASIGKISYGPLLDVFMLDMRSYRRPNATAETAVATPTSSGRTQLAWLKRELMRSQATWKVIAADMPIGADQRRRRWRRATGPPAAARCEIADLLSLHQARGRPQHGVAHRRHALHRRALLRSEPRGVPGLRAVLGVRLRAAARRHLAAPSRSTTRSARARSFRRAARRSGGQPGAVLRPAVLRPRRRSTVRAR